MHCAPHRSTSKGILDARQIDDENRVRALSLERDTAGYGSRIFTAGFWLQTTDA